MSIDKIKKVITEKEIIDFISKIVSMPSYSGIENQEEEVAKYIHNTFVNEGIDSELVDVQDGRLNVIAKLKGKGKGKGKTLLLTGHTDTVPPFEMENPFEVQREGGVLKGLGVLDMKGPLACMIYGIIAIKRAGIVLDGDVIFAGVIDEEVKSLGSIDLIEKGISADAAIVGEPTNFEICTCHRGLESLEFHFQGKTVHSGKQGEGINAISKAAKFIHKLDTEVVPKIRKETHPIIGHSTLNYGTIIGGTQICTVAGECTLKLDTRWVPGVEYKHILDGYEKIINELEAEDQDFKCTFKVEDESLMKDGYVHEALETSVDHPIVNITMEKTQNIYNERRGVSCFNAWSDGGLLNSYAQIPTIVFGPGDLETAHSADEQFRIDHILPATLIYSLVAMEYCK